MEHTQGPWRSVKNEDHWMLMGTAEDGEEGCYLVGTVNDGTEVFENAANLALIQSAPELLALAEAVYAYFGDYRFQWAGRSTPEGQSLLSLMCSTLAKATDRGEEAVQDDYGTRFAREEYSRHIAQAPDLLAFAQKASS